MPVAKSYTNMKIVGDIFSENGRNYVNVMGPKGLKKVRWYSDAEYRRMYPDAPVVDALMTLNGRHAFGFREKGYITLYKGDEEVIRDWAWEVKPPRAWYNETFHFFTPSHIDAGDPPAGIKPIILTWEEVNRDDIHMRPHEEVKKYIEKLMKEN